MPVNVLSPVRTRPPARRTHAILRCCLALALVCYGHGATAAGPGAPSGTGSWRDLGHGELLQEKAQLRWTSKDNGEDISWDDAKSYCAALGKEWRLPSIDELRALYGAAERAGDVAACGNAVCKAPSLFHLSASWLWSGTVLTPADSTEYEELAWGLMLVNGRSTMALRFAPYASRAVCVHGA